MTLPLNVCLEISVALLKEMNFSQDIFSLKSGLLIRIHKVSYGICEYHYKLKKEYKTRILELLFGIKISGEAYKKLFKIFQIILLRSIYE